MKKNVLVFPCGSEIGLEVFRAVEKSTFFHLIGASSVDDHGRFVYPDYIGGVPLVTEVDFISRLKEIVKENNIDIIYPTMDSVIAKLKNAEDELGCKVVASPIETADTCLSKLKTYTLFQNKIKTPRIYSSINEIVDYPVFCKPIVGYGSRRIKKITDRNELTLFMSNNTDCLILEYLPGEEYTVDCFTDRHGKLLFSQPRCRARISNGISVNTYPIKDVFEFQKIAEIIGSELTMRGAWFFQMKRNSQGILTLLEIASRFGGSSALFRGCGVNFPLLSLFDIIDYDVSIISNDYEIEMDRALDNKYKINIKFNQVYLDYDDTLVIDKKYFNTEVVKFIFQCKNEGIKVILLSRHEGDLEKCLKELGIDRLFDQVIHIGKGDEKKDFIDPCGSILIDDSFSERARVLKEKNVPVFSLDMVSLLIK